MPIRIESLVGDEAPLAPDIPAGAALERFNTDASCVALPVVFQRTLIGLVSRSQLFDLALQLSRGRLDSLPVARVLDPEADSFAADTPLGQVADELAGRGGKGFRLGVVVTQAGSYVGYVSPERLASALARENTQRARQQQLAAQRIRTLKAEAQSLRTEGHRALARLGHEVRTPLTAILGHAEQIARTAQAPETRQRAGTLVEASATLADLVTRAVDAGKAGSGAVDVRCEPFSLRGLANELAALWTSPAEAAGLRLSVSLPQGQADALAGDAGLLRQIGSNLLSNAVKYSTGSRIDLSLEALAREEGMARLVLQVTDDGEGIAAERAGDLFQPFTRLNPSGAAEGHGLGLSICASLARAMGGEISYATSASGGAAFTLAVPVKLATPRLASPPATGSNRPRRGAFRLGNILLVEDHAPSQALIAAALREAGWTVDCAETIAQGLAKAAGKAYQAILCDFFVSDGTADMFLRRLRSEAGRNRSTLCLALSADASQGRRAQCEAAGFAGLIPKPVRAPELIMALADHVSGARQAPARNWPQSA